MAVYVRGYYRKGGADKGSPANRRRRIESLEAKVFAQLGSIKNPAVRKARQALAFKLYNAKDQIRIAAGKAPKSLSRRRTKGRFKI